MQFIVRDPEKEGKKLPPASAGKKECPCGKIFTPYRPYQLYCSDKCQEKYGSGKSGRYARKPYETKICENPLCSAEFRTNDAKRKYCSGECYLVMQSLRKVEAHEQKCKICGKIFLTSHASKEYCGVDCRKEGRRRRSEVRKAQLRSVRPTR